MASTYTVNSGIEKPGSGEQSGTWGATTNTNFDIIDRLSNGVGAITLSGTTHTLTTSDGSLSDGHYKVLVLGGSPSGTNTITISPNDQDKMYLVTNGTNQSAVFTQGSGGNATIEAGKTKLIYADGAGSGAAVTDASSTLVATGGTEVSTDASPQLGGNLDVNGNSIVSTSDGHISLVPSGTGDVRLGTDTVRVGDTNGDATITTNGTGDLTLSTNAGTNSGTVVIADGADGDISITPNGTGSVVIDGLSMPQADGSANQVLKTDGSGNIGFTTLSTFSLPSGTVLPFAGSSAPSGYLLCFGQAISRSTYASLFSAIGTTYGAGDGSSTFNVPDLRGRAIAGQDDMGGSSADRLTNQSGGVNGDTLGASGGAETHTLTTAQLAAHTHTSNVSIPAAAGSTEGVSGVTTVINTGGTGSFTGTSGSAGSGSAHNNVQPTLILNYMIAE